MTVLERIKKTCREKKNISITTLEVELNYSNGSLAKAKDIPSSRIMEIAEYLEVSMDYLMTGKEFSVENVSPEMAEMITKIYHNEKFSNSLKKFLSLSENKQNHVLELIELLGE